MGGECLLVPVILSSKFLILVPRKLTSLPVCVQSSYEASRQLYANVELVMNELLRRPTLAVSAPLNRFNFTV